MTASPQDSGNDMTTPGSAPPEHSGGPPPLPEDWHYSVAGAQAGPVPASRIAELLASGEIGPGTVVWQRGWKEWRPLAETELVALLPKGAPSQQTDPPGAASPPAGGIPGFGGSPVFVWAKCGALLGFVVGLVSCCAGAGRADATSPFLFAIVGALLGAAARKWIARTFRT